MGTFLFCLQRFSGIIAMLCAWFGVALPAIKFGINSQSDTLTSAITKSASVKIIANSALIIGALFQFVFLSYLIRRFSISFYSIGSILYIITYIATICIALFSEARFPRFHYAIALVCFLVGPFSLLFIGFDTNNSGDYSRLVSILSVLSYFGGQIFLWIRFKFGTALMELWGIAILTIWTIAMSII